MTSINTPETKLAKQAHRQRDWFASPRLILFAYLSFITLAEYLTTFVSPVVGMIAHGIILITLLIHGAFVREKSIFAVLMTLLIAPLIRILSLSLPLANFPYIDWFMIISIPVFVAIIYVLRTMGYSIGKVGLNLRSLPFQGLVAITGIIFGFVEYAILRPGLVLTDLNFNQLFIPSLILLICTGLMEELIFRGMLQQTAERLLGRPFALLFGALVFTVLHIGWQSIIDLLFVFAVGIYWGWIFLRTRSIVGTTLAHGLTNIMLFLVLPVLSRTSIAPQNTQAIPPRVEVVANAPNAPTTDNTTISDSTITTSASSTGINQVLRPRDERSSTPSLVIILIGLIVTIIITAPLVGPLPRQRERFLYIFPRSRPRRGLP